MKNKNILIAFFILIAISACDIIEAPYEKEDIDFVIDTTTRNVLIEDFTGFRCGNCPEASETAEKIAEHFKGKVFVLGVHAGPLSIPTPGRKYDFRTSEGKELEDYYNLIATPYGLVNRRSFNGQYLLSPSAWAGYTEPIIEELAEVKIGINPEYNESSKLITANLDLYYTRKSDLNHFVAVYIVEDSIVQYQQDDSQFPNIHVLDYVHNNVLRGSMNGTWGSQVSSSIVKAGKSVSLSFNYKIPTDKDWRADKLSLLVFVHNNATKEILNVEKIKLLKE